MSGGGRGAKAALAKRAEAATFCPKVPGDDVLLIQSVVAGAAGKPKSKAAIDFALAAIRGGNVAKARMLLHDRLAEDPEDAFALALLAEIAVEEGQYDQAIVFRRRAATAAPVPAFQIALVRHMNKYGSPGMVLKEIEDLPAAVRDDHAVMAMEASASGLVGDHDRRIEAHVFHVAHDWYDAVVRVDFVAWLRETRAFAGMEALQTQLGYDESAARAALLAPDVDRAG